MPSPGKPPAPLTVDAIRGNDTGYVAYHAPRFAYVLGALDTVIGPESRILDIGRSKLTELLRERYARPVDTLGFDPEEKSERGNHYHCDLNSSQHQAQWRRDLPTYDIVVMAEVIEHLYTAPQLVLAFLRTLIKPGGMLLIQTPNGASLSKRIKLLFGRNPYEMIRENNTNPGHFREYTIPELRRLANGAGFDVVACETKFYFDARYGHHGAQPRVEPVVGTLKNLVYPMFPGFLRQGVTMVVRAR